ncbi:MAG: glycosyltransferase family 4 protein [Gemmataceae bacterium]|nr:glycosyltransferase family 4 protein [Gemmataceae bacterium]
MKILFVTPGTEPDGATSQLSLLARRLPARGFTAHVCALGPAGGCREFGVPATSLGWSRVFDLRPVWRLRRLIADVRPDVIHAFRPASLRALALAVGRTPCPLVVSRPLPPRGKDLARLDRWLLGRADRILVRGAAEAERGRRAGVSPERMAVVPPGVEESAPTVAAGADGRAVVCAGRLERYKGYHDAVWVFDMLRYLYDDLQLVVLGDGPDRPRLEHFVKCLRAVGRVHFQGTQADAAGRLAGGEVVWVPSLADGGVGAALEAMAAGRPVVASRWPGLAEVVTHGETGLLVSPGDKIALGRQTRLLLNDEGLRRRLGEAGRERVRREFSADAAARATAAIYERLAG